MRATSFIFDGIPSEKFGVMIYYFDSMATDHRDLFKQDIVEDRLNTRYDPIFHGVGINSSREYTLTFGSREYMSQHEVERIADWLTSHNSYKWLEICQDDHKDFRFRVIMSNLESIEVNGIPTAFSCTVSTDSQFAYEYPQTFTFRVRDGKVLSKNTKGELVTAEQGEIFNPSSYNGYIYPTIDLTVDDDCDEFGIINQNDNNNIFAISKLPNNSSTIIDRYREYYRRYRRYVDELIPPVKDKLEKLRQFLDDSASIEKVWKADQEQAGSPAWTEEWIKSKTDVEIDEKIQSLLDELSKTKWYTQFVTAYDPNDDTGWDNIWGPQHQKGMQVVPIQIGETAVFYIIRKFERDKLVSNYENGVYIPTGNYELDTLYNKNGEYDYVDYNLIPLWNCLYYLIKLDNSGLSSIESEELEQWLKVKLLLQLLAIRDFRALLNEYNQLVDAMQAAKRIVDSYNLSGDADVVGDELNVYADCKNQVMKCNRDGVNIYEYFGDKYGNHYFLRLLRGENRLAFTGSGTVRIGVEFLRKVGL